MLRTARRLTVATVALSFLLAVAASAAHAGVSVNDNTPTGPSQALTATISSPPTGATHYTLAECNVTDPSPAAWGRDCRQAGAVGFTRISTASTTITVFDTFTNYSFVPGQSPQYGPSTACDGSAGSDPCAVVVSWYSFSTGIPLPVGTAEKADLTFN